jgi:hypothetical protein
MDAIDVGNKLVAHFWRANPGQFSRVPKFFSDKSGEVRLKAHLGPESSKALPPVFAPSTRYVRLKGTSLAGKNPTCILSSTLNDTLQSVLMTYRQIRRNLF